MKRSLFLAAVVLVCTGCFAQKANVRRAETLISAEAPDFKGARAVIAEALQNDETKGQAKTWFVAGLIGYTQNQTEYVKLQEGKGGQDYVLRGAAVYESYNYWLKADEIAMTPVYNKKGKAKVDTRTRKQIADKMVEYFELRELINYAYDLLDKQEYAKAYDMFKAYLALPDLEMMQDKRYQERMPKDTLYELFQFQSALTAYNAAMYQEAANVFRTLVDKNVKAVASAQFLYQSYINMQDSATANKVLDECIERFPTEAWFVQNRINNLVSAGQMEDAIIYLDRAIATDPQIQYYLLKASILDVQQRFDEAIATYEEALARDNSNADIYYNYGVVFVDKANKMNDDAAYLDAKAYKAARKNIDETLKQALPYFKKAYEMDSENFTYKRQLRALYYRLGMTNEYNALSD